MTTYQLLKQLTNQRGGVHSDLRKKPDAPASEPAAAGIDKPSLGPAPAAPSAKPKEPTLFSHLIAIAVAAGFLGCFWMIFQLVNTSHAHEVRFQRLINALDKQEAGLRAINGKVAHISEELPEMGRAIAALGQKADAAMAEAAKLSEIVAGQVEVIEGLKQRVVSVTAQT